MRIRRVRRRVLPALISLALCAAAPARFDASEEAPGGKRNQLTLEEWKEQSEELRSAYMERDAAARVTLLETFLKEHPNAEARPGVLLRLSETLLDSGSRDFGKVEALLQESARSEGADCYLLTQVLHAYANHGELPLSGARNVFRIAEAEAERERRDAGKPDSKPGRLRAAREAGECRQSVKALEGEILLERGETASALPLLREAESEGVGLGKDLLRIDEAGRTQEPVPTGSLDSLRCSLAAAYERSGNLPEARRTLLRIVGFNLTEADREKALRLRTKLGVEAPEGVEVRAEPIRAPDLTFSDLSRKKVHLRDDRGRIVLLNFWSTT
jgi:hypothetical protein